MRWQLSFILKIVKTSHLTNLLLYHISGQKQHKLGSIFLFLMAILLCQPLCWFLFLSPTNNFSFLNFIYLFIWNRISEQTGWHLSEAFFAQTFFNNLNQLCSIHKLNRLVRGSADFCFHVPSSLSQPSHCMYLEIMFSVLLHTDNLL